MAKGVNKCIFIGAAGSDVEVKYTPAGKAVASVSIAVNESWKDKDGQKQEKTEWIRLVMFGRLGEIAGEYVKKGSKIYVEGRYSTDKWEDKQGNKRESVKVVCHEMQMLDSRGDAPQKQAEPESHTPPSSDQPVDDWDDNIPF